MASGVVGVWHVGGLVARFFEGQGIFFAVDEIMGMSGASVAICLDERANGGTGGE